MEKLKNAEAQLRAKRQEYEKQKQLVNEIKTKELLPDAIKKYEGKCFKEINSYGVGCGNGDWFKYYFVTKVTSYNFCEAISMQIDSYGKFDVENEEHLPLSICNNEIDKEEFLSAVRGFEQHFANMIKLCH